MNPRILLSLTCAAALAAVPVTQARDSNVGRNVVLGGIAGAIIGDASDQRPVEGAIIGAAAGLLFTAATEGHGYRSDYYAPAACERRVVVARPCPPPARVVYAPAPCDRRVVVVRPSCPPPRVVVVDRRNDRCDDRYDRRHDDRRGRSRYDDRRDRRDRRDRDDRGDYAYNDRYR